MLRIWNFFKDYSILLILGSILGTFLANTNAEIYNNILNLKIENSFIGHYHDGHYTLDLGFIVNDVLMTFFFAVAGKEVWEGFALRKGALRGKKSFPIVLSTFGGIIGPVGVYIIVAFLSGRFEELNQGWAIPTATDIAFAYLFGVLIFGKNHPVIKYLLALAILDDAIGIVIIAVFYPTGHLNPLWLMGSLTAGVLSFVLFNKMKIFSKYGLVPYIIAGIFSWFCFFKAGIHPVLSMIPIIMSIPHSETDLGLFSEEQMKKKDLLNQFEHKLENIIPIILCLFGFVNAGVEISSLNSATFSVLIALLVGKPLGITIFSNFAEKIFGLPEGIKKSDLPILGMIAGIGFTVSLFVSLQAFPEGDIQNGAKMGALLSFFAFVPAFLWSKIKKIQKVN